MRVQERHVAIAGLQGQIAATDLAYARDLVNYQNERFLNRDFWDALAGVARRSLHRYLDLAGQAAWFAERALAYQLATPVRVIRLDYFDLRMRDVGGADRLGLDLAELEAIRLGAARITVPITRTYSLARDLPLAFGQLKRTGRCTFGLTDDDLLAGHPGTFAHRIRSVDVAVDAPGTAVATRGILTNGGFSLLRTAPGAAPVPLVRFADAYPISQHRMAGAYAGQPGEQLLPFEGSGFTTTWSLRLPKGANAATLDRVTDVRLTFELRAAYDAQQVAAAAPAVSGSRSMFVSALATDPKGLATLRKPATPTAKLSFDLARARRSARRHDQQHRPGPPGCGGRQHQRQAADRRGRTDAVPHQRRDRDVERRGPRQRRPRQPRHSAAAQRGPRRVTPARGDGRDHEGQRRRPARAGAGRPAVGGVRRPLTFRPAPLRPDDAHGCAVLCGALEEISTATPRITAVGIQSGNAVASPATAAPTSTGRPWSDPANSRTAPTNASTMTAQVSTPPTAAITSRARGESPWSMSKTLKAPAKSSCASGMGNAWAAPRTATPAAAS